MGESGYCQFVQSLFPRYVRGQCTKGESLFLDEHCTDCQECRKKLQYAFDEAQTTSLKELLYLTHPRKLTDSQSKDQGDESTYLLTFAENEDGLDDYCYDEALGLTCESNIKEEYAFAKAREETRRDRNESIQKTIETPAETLNRFAEASEQKERKSVDESNMSVRMDVAPRPLDKTERKLFTYFSEIPGICEQISVAIADIHNGSGDHTSKSGNVIIVGYKGSGKTKLAESLVLAVCKDLNFPAVKTAKINAIDLNRTDPATIVKKMAGGFLIVESAGKLAEGIVAKLNHAMESETDDMVVILEDEKQGMKVLLEKYPAFAEKFTSKIKIPVFTNDELVSFGKIYAREKGYCFDETAVLALYTMIGKKQKKAKPVTVSMVREIIEEAIAESKNRRFSPFEKKQVRVDGQIILRAKDFHFNVYF